MSRNAWLVVAAVVAAAVIAVAVWRTGPRQAGDLRLGATFPLTGEVASYGQKAKRGIEVATDEQNATGGVLGRRVIIDFQDDRNDKKEAVGIVTKFATVDKVPVIFGSAGSGVTLSIAPIANTHQVLLVSPVSSSSELSTKGGPFFFRTVPADDVQADVLAKWVQECGVKTVAVVFTNNSWGKPLSEGFAQKFLAAGGKVLLQEGVAENTSDFRSIITKLKDLAGTEAIVSPTYPKEGGLLVRQLKEMGVKLPLFGGDNWVSPEFLSIAGDAAEGVSFTAPAESTSPLFADFARRYKDKYGEQPDVLAAYGYDAAMAVYKAIESAGGTEADKLRDAMLKGSFTGVSGPIAFRPNGDVASEAFARMTVQGGKPVPKK